MHPTLVQFASESATPFTSRELSDAYLTRYAGLPTIRMSGGDAGFVSGFLRKIDEEIGPQLG
jgi:hypothetical protein